MSDAVRGRAQTCFGSRCVVVCFWFVWHLLSNVFPQLMSLGAAPPESDSTMPTSGSKEVAARLAMMIKPCQGSAQPVAQNQQPQTSPPTRYGLHAANVWCVCDTATMVPAFMHDVTAWKRALPAFAFPNRHGSRAAHRMGANQSLVPVLLTLACCRHWCEHQVHVSCSAPHTHTQQANLPPEQVQALLASDAGAALALMTAKMQRGGGSA